MDVQEGLGGKGHCMIEKRKMGYCFIIFLLTAMILTFRPGMWLIHKPANSENAHYVKGWADGCLSGTNSYSLLYAPLLDKPFAKGAEDAIDTGAKANDHAEKTAEKTNYKTGWNEGFTLCRYYQSAVYELMQFAILITTLLFIGYLLAKKKA
jgi:ABC-type glycerol-3-phosphate transport system permease component